VTVIVHLDLVPPAAHRAAASRHLDRSVAASATSSHMILTLSRSFRNVLRHVIFGRPPLHLPPAGVHVAYLLLWPAGEVVNVARAQSYGICALSQHLLAFPNHPCAWSLRSFIRSLYETRRFFWDIAGVHSCTETLNDAVSEMSHFCGCWSYSRFVISNVVLCRYFNDTAAKEEIICNRLRIEKKQNRTTDFPFGKLCNIFSLHFLPFDILSIIIIMCRLNYQTTGFFHNMPVLIICFNVCRSTCSRLSFSSCNTFI